MTKVVMVPDYIAHRIAVWNAAVAARKEVEPSRAPIQVTLPDGSVKESFSGVTTPMDIAMGISETLGRKALVAVVNGDQWDMTRPLGEDCTLKICGWDSPEGKSVLWHSTAHMLGEALEYKIQRRTLHWSSP